MALPGRGERLPLSPTHLDEQGRGVAVEEGVDVHVAGLFPGERGVARMEAISRQHARAFAVAEGAIEPLPGRREPPCLHHERVRGGACGGCPLLELSPVAQHAVKVAELTRLGLPVARIEGGAAEADGFGYRASSKRVVGGRAGALILGSRTHRGKRVADMRHCLVDHPRIAEAFRELTDQGSRLGVVPHVDGAGDLRFVWAKTDGDRVLLTLITADEDSHAARVLPEALTCADAVAWAVQPGGGNTMRGASVRALKGAPHLRITLDGGALEVGALDFLQPNPSVATLAYRALVEDQDGAPLRGDRAFDLYAGTGRTTALLRRGFAEVLACEADAAMAERLGVRAEPAGAFLARNAGVRPSLIVANPPRAGLEDAAELLRAAGAPELRIMSCNPHSLARDLAVLAPDYAIAWARAFDTLPNTAHVEVVVSLLRRGDR